MNSTSIIREVAAVGALLASYPIDAVARRGPVMPGMGTLLENEPVILVHGFGGNRSNLLGLAAYLKLAGFDRIEYFEYPRRQLISASAEELGRLVTKVSGESGVHRRGDLERPERLLERRDGAEMEGQGQSVEVAGPAPP